MKLSIYWNSVKYTTFNVISPNGYGICDNYLWVKINENKTLYIPWHTINRFEIDRS